MITKSPRCFTQAIPRANPHDMIVAQFDQQQGSKDYLEVIPSSISIGQSARPQEETTHSKPASQQYSGGGLAATTCPAGQEAILADSYPAQGWQAPAHPGKFQHQIFLFRQKRS
jgi:hypothetical protein